MKFRKKKKKKKTPSSGSPIVLCIQTDIAKLIVALHILERAKMSQLELCVCKRDVMNGYCLLGRDAIYTGLN